MRVPNRVLETVLKLCQRPGGFTTIELAGDLAYVEAWARAGIEKRKSPKPEQEQE